MLKCHPQTNGYMFAASNNGYKHRCPRNFLPTQQWVRSRSHRPKVTWLLVVWIILKNDGVRQWEGWHPMYEMENKLNVWNHQLVHHSYHYPLYIYINIHHIVPLINWSITIKSQWWYTYHIIHPLIYINHQTTLFSDPLTIPPPQLSLSKSSAEAGNQGTNHTTLK